MMPFARVAVPVAASLLLAAPTLAYDVFLDADDDGDPYTFVNEVTGPETVPVNLVVRFTAEDLGITHISFVVQWGYGGEEPGNPGCSDVYGSIGYYPYTALPDRPPFAGIVPYTCACRLRCSCDAQMVVEADVSSPGEPGNYVLATLDFSRVGSSIAECGSPTPWPLAQFSTYAWFPAFDHPGDPRSGLTLAATSTSAEEPAGLRTWGRVKGEFR